MSADLDPTLRALLVCPLCRGVLDDRPDALICRACALAFPIVEGIPLMVRERARPLDAPERRG